MEIGHTNIQQTICEHISDSVTYANFAKTNKRNAEHALKYSTVKKTKFSEPDIYQHTLPEGFSNLVQEGSYTYIHKYSKLPNTSKHGQEEIWFEDAAQAAVKTVIRTWDTGIMHGPVKLYLAIRPYMHTGLPFKLAELNYHKGKMHGNQVLYHNWSPNPNPDGEYNCNILTTVTHNGMVDLNNNSIGTWQLLDRIAQSGSIQAYEQQRLDSWRLCDICRCHIYPDMEYFHCRECEDYDHCLNCEAAGFTTSEHPREHNMLRFNIMYNGEAMDQFFQNENNEVNNPDDRDNAELVENGQ